MSYDFSQLSSLDFEELCRDLLQQQEGIRYELFKPGKDQGIDARYLNGKACTIVQCKHYLNSGFKKLLNVLHQEELTKVKELQPNRYVVMTSVPLSASNKKQIQDRLSPYIKSQSDIFGQEDLNNLLGLHPQIEEKHFKLWLTSTKILDRILHNAVITQSEQLVERIKRKIPIYVQNESFQKAINTLGQYHFVIISGEPGVGKTTLAEMLLLKYLEKGFRPFEVKDPKEAYDIYQPDQSFIFYYDDFLGLTYFGDNLYNHEKIENIINLIDLVRRSKSSRLILTSREYIISQAKINHERFSNFDFFDAKYQLRLSEYTKLDRARILYNHLYFSDLDESYIKEIVVRKAYRLIVSHRNYMPRIISSLTQANRLKNVSESEYPGLFLEILRNPKELWTHPFKQITPSARSVLLILLSLGANSNSLYLEKASNAFLDLSATRNNLPRDYDDYYQAISELVGSFLQTIEDRITFQNPSLKDFLEDYLLQRPAFVKHMIEASVYLQQIFIIRSLTQESASAKYNYPTSIFVESIVSSNPISSREEPDSKFLPKFISEIKLLIDMELEVNDSRLRSYILRELKYACAKPYSLFLDDLIEIARLVNVNEQVINRQFSNEVLREINKAVEIHVNDEDYWVSLEDLSNFSEIAEKDILPSMSVEVCRSFFQEGIDADFFLDDMRQLEDELDLEYVKDVIKKLERLTGIKASNLLDWIDEKIEERNEQSDDPDAWDLYKASKEEREEEEKLQVPEEDFETTINHMFSDLMDR